MERLQAALTAFRIIYYAVVMIIPAFSSTTQRGVSHPIIVKSVYPGIPLDIQCDAQYPFIQLYQGDNAIHFTNNEDFSRLGIEIRNENQVHNVAYISVIRINWDPEIHETANNLTIECIDIPSFWNITSIFTVSISYQSKLPPPQEVKILNNVIMWLEPLFNSSSVAQYVIEEVSISYTVYFSNIGSSVNFTRATEHNNYDLAEIIADICNGLEYSVEVSASCNAGGSGETSPALSYMISDCQTESTGLSSATGTTTMQATHIDKTDHENQNSSDSIISVSTIIALVIGAALLIIMSVTVIIFSTAIMCTCVYLKYNQRKKKKNPDDIICIGNSTVPVYEEVTNVLSVKYKVHDNPAYDCVTNYKV